MAHDGSIVAQVENWMVAAIETADSGNLFQHVDHFDGARHNADQAVVEQIFESRDRVAMVFCTGGLARDLSANDQALGTEYVVWVGVNNARSMATARLGASATEPGIHLLREIVQVALHDKHTGASNARLATERCTYLRFESVWQQATQWIVALTFAVPEVPV